MIVKPTLCASCVHFKKGATCAAFPKGIPENIYIWGEDHRQVVPGQTGTTVHKLQSGKEEEYEDWFFTVT